MNRNTTITRRGFINSATRFAAAVSLASMARGQKAPESPPIPAIDTHVHFYDPDRPGGIPWPPKTDTQLYRPMLPAGYRQKFVDRFNIAGIVVVEANAAMEDDLWVLDIAKDEPLIVGYVARLELATPQFKANFDRLAATPIFRGLRIDNNILGQNIDKPEFQADLKRLPDGDLSLDVVAGTGIVKTVPKIAKLYPNLRIIFDHLPHRTWDGSATTLENQYKEVAALPNVYAKISEVLHLRDDKLVEDPAYYQPALDVLYKLFGPQRVIYGSNFPVSERLGPYEKVYKVVADYFNAKGRDVAERYFWRNSMNAYKWVPRGAAASLK
jgi:predicted TIM-barrel fold metal-dependent hydrolase